MEPQISKIPGNRDSVAADKIKLSIYNTDYNSLQIIYI